MLDRAHDGRVNVSWLVDRKVFLANRFQIPCGLFLTLPVVVVSLICRAGAADVQSLSRQSSSEEYLRRTRPGTVSPLQLPIAAEIITDPDATE